MKIFIKSTKSIIRHYTKVQEGVPAEYITPQDGFIAPSDEEGDSVVYRIDDIKENSEDTDCVDLTLYKDGTVIMTVLKSELFDIYEEFTEEVEVDEPKKLPKSTKYKLLRTRVPEENLPMVCYSIRGYDGKYYTGDKIKSEQWVYFEDENMRIYLDEASAHKSSNMMPNTEVVEFELDKFYNLMP